VRIGGKPTTDGQEEHTAVARERKRHLRQLSCGGGRRLRERKNVRYEIRLFGPEKFASVGQRGVQVWGKKKRTSEGGARLLKEEQITTAKKSGAARENSLEEKSNWGQRIDLFKTRKGVKKWQRWGD